MQPTHLILRYGEIFLKGKNRPLFENKLIVNVKKITKNNDVKKIRGRLIMPYFSKHNLLRKVFGLTSYSPAYFTGKDFTEIKKKTKEIMKGKKGSFKVICKRSDKRFPLKSPQINVLLGQFLENENLSFDMKNPKFLINVEINQLGAFVYFESFTCFGGLPVGIEGSTTLIYENENSLLAGLLMMKRGVKLEVIMEEKMDLSLLENYCPDEIKKADRKDKDILISGQTFADYNNLKLNNVILRPLIGFSEQEIKQQLTKFKSIADEF